MKGKIFLPIFLIVLLVMPFSSASIFDWLNIITGKVTDESGTNFTLEEQVKCVFLNSYSAQECYSDDNAFKCSGTGICVIKVSGENGKMLTWKSSCGGEMYTVIDGSNEDVEFKCESVETLPTPTTPESLVREQIKCVFTNSDAYQKCYTSDGRFGCSGTGTCIADVSGEKGAKLTWESSCVKESKDIISTIINEENENIVFECEQLTTAPAPTPIVVKEQVKCIFANSDSEQKCSSNEFGCSGTGTCVVEVSGEKGKMLTWKSSCGGYAYTINDGNNEYVEFRCEQAQEPVVIPAYPTETIIQTTTTTPIAIEEGPPLPSSEIDIGIKEQIECIFWDSDVLINPHTARPETCYTDNGRFGCAWTGEVVEEANGRRYAHCIAEVFGKKGTKLTWKSSCGGYAYTVIDGNNEAAEFKCMPSSEVEEEQITGRGFRSAYWQCYDGIEQTIRLSDSCKPSEVWQREAREFCKNHCYEDKSKCGVNSFSISDECYPDFEEFIFVSPIEEERKKQAEVIEREQRILICKDSCPLDEKCYPFGYRKDGKYCSDEGAFKEQFKGEETCENNFECSTNVCVDGKCMSSGLIQKILSWFKTLFG